MESFCCEINGFQNEMHRLLGQEISRSQDLFMLRDLSAEAKLATFLLGVSQRFGARKLSSNQFSLSMSRHEIGEYLGLAVETISRLFSRFTEHGILEVERKNITIKDMYALKKATGQCVNCPTNDS